MILGRAPIKADTNIRPSHGPVHGLVLSGGGARGAYQTGVMKAVGEMAKRLAIDSPFQVYSGISAGSINAAFLAGSASQFTAATKILADLWANLNTSRIISVSPFTLGRLGAGLLKQLSTGAITKKTPVRSLLDTTPLRELIESQIRTGKIQNQIDRGVLKGLAVTATSYDNSHSRTFVQAGSGFEEWQRVRRESQACQIGTDHIMASSAIPVLFPPVKVGDEYFGDGGLRNNTPLSPAIHLGANRLLIVGVKMNNQTGELPECQGREPTLARMGSVLIHGLLMDAIDVDVARLEKINTIVGLLDQNGRDSTKLQKIDSIWLSPSEYLGGIALKWVDRVPKALRYMIGGLGSEEEAADLISYLLFEPEYCQDLIALGYSDAMNKEEALFQFLQP